MDEKELPPLPPPIDTADHALLEQRKTTQAIENLLPAAEGSLMKQHEHGEHLKEIVKNTSPKDVQKIEITGAQITAIKGDKGDTPKRGVDYYTDEEKKSFINEILPQATPIVGQHYYTEAEKQTMAAEVQGRIRVPADGYTPIKGKDYNDGKKGEPGERGKPGESIKGDKGEPGDDGSPDTAEEILEKLKSLPEGSRLDYESLDNLPNIPEIINRMRPARDIASKDYSTSEMTDVSMQGIVAGQILQWDGVRFIPHTISSSGVNQVFGEVLSMSGSNFTLAHTPIVGTVKLFRGGARQTPTSDFTMAGAVGTVTPAPDPSGNEVFLVDYDW